MLFFHMKDCFFLKNVFGGLGDLTLKSSKFGSKIQAIKHHYTAFELSQQPINSEVKILGLA